MARVVRVLPDVPAIDKEFDYEVPAALDAEVGVGTVVRVELHGRRVGGWVVADAVTPPPAVNLRPLAKVTGWGPDPALIDLARWAAWRWAGRPATFLKTASPDRAVRTLPAVAQRSSGAAGQSLADRTVRRLPPTADRVGAVLAMAAGRQTLVLAPSVSDVDRLARRLRQGGATVAVMPGDWARAAAGADVVVGARAAAWAPCPGLGLGVVLDAHDEAYQDERAPTWNAWQVLAERCDRAAVPCQLISPAPTVEQLAWAQSVLIPERPDERGGWPTVEVADRRLDDPRLGLLSEPLTRLIRGDGRVVCVLNRKGRARLLACGACGGMATCERCGASVEQFEAGHLRCRRCGWDRPAVCSICGGTKLKNLRPGVARLAEEMSALAGEPVTEVTGETVELPGTRILIGTEAVLHRAGRADAVAFLDFDQEILAPRFRAAEQAMALVVRAARLLGRRTRGGRLLIQTRLPDHDVVRAAVRSDPSLAATAEEGRRRELRLPPFSALARLSGVGAVDYVASLQPDGAVTVAAVGEDQFLVRATDQAALADALARVPRPAGRLRIEVDPLRV